MRLHIMFIGDFEKAVTWSNDGREGLASASWTAAGTCMDMIADGRADLRQKNAAIVHKTIQARSRRTSTS